MKKIQIKYTKGTPDELYQSLVSIQSAFNNSISNINNKYPIWTDKGDFRYLIFIFSQESIQLSILNTVFLKDYLSKPHWWKENKTFSTDTIELDNIIDITSKYQEEIKLTLVHSLFILLELFLRSIAIELLISSESKEFKISQVRDKIIHQCSLDKSYIALIKMLQSIRNTFHYGGIHTRPDEVIEYKSLKYEFIRNAPSPGPNWDELKFLILELNLFYINLTSCKKISEVIHLENPYSNIEAI